MELWITYCDVDSKKQAPLINTEAPLINTEVDTLLASSCAAKNELTNNKGFSPNQIVFGKNICLPIVIDDDIPALGKTPQSDQNLAVKTTKALLSNDNTTSTEDTDKIAIMCNNTEETMAYEHLHLKSNLK